MLTAESMLPPTDHAFLMGDGLFETLKVHSGKAVWLSEHYARLSGSASFAGINIPEENKIAKLCLALIEKNEISNGYMRITVSRGSSKSGRASDMPEQPNIVITGDNLLQSNTKIKAGFASWPSNESDPTICHKTTSRFSLVIAGRGAKKRGLGELVFINTKGVVTEGLISNIFFVKDKTIKTPAKECGLLAGIVRAKVLEIAEKLGIKTEEGQFTKADLLDADEIFFTNSNSLVTLCAQFENRPFAEGNVSKKLKQKLISLLPQ